MPYPGGGEKWGGNGVGDDLYSFGFDGAYLWSGGRKTPVNRSNPEEPFIRKSKFVTHLIHSMYNIKMKYNKLPEYLKTELNVNKFIYIKNRS